MLREARRAGSAEQPVERVPDRGTGDPELLRLEFQEALIGALALLTPREFVVFWLTFVEECADSEIAARLDRSVGAIHSARHRLRHKLRQALERWAFGDGPPRRTTCGGA